MRIVFKTLLVLASIFMAWICYKSIMDPIEFNEQKDIRDRAVINRLKDIRKAQLAYKDANGVYAGSFKDLLSFIKEGQMPVIKKTGELTDQQLEKGLTDSIAVHLKKEDAAKYGIEDYDMFVSTFRRDTSYVSVMKSVFGENYNLDSLAYVPYGKGAMFEMNTGEYETASGTKIPLFEAKVPFKVYLDGLNRQQIINLVKQATTNEKYEGLMVGDVNQPNNNAGNWE